MTKECQTRIFLNQLMKAQTHLLDVRIGFRFNGKGHHRLGELNARIPNRRPFVAKGITRLTVLQLADRHNVTRYGSRDRLILFPKNREHMPAAFFHLPRRIVQRGIRLQHTGIDAHVGETTDKGIDECLEHHCREGLGLQWLLE